MSQESHAAHAASLIDKINRVPRLHRLDPPTLDSPPGSTVNLRQRAPSPPRSRRDLIAAVTGRAQGRPGARTGNPAGGRIGFVEHNLDERDSILALVHRITQGFNLAEYQRAVGLGYDAYLEEQLDYLSIDDSAMAPRLANFPTLDMSPAELASTYVMDSYIPFNELKGAALVRSVHSKRQLFERMCEFWSDHFSIDHQKDPEWAFKPEDDKTVTRANALGTFPQVLSASAHSGAMMFYLDNWLNFAGTPQENWARELMELHTLGVGGGFTEEDVKEVARAFTGWTLELDANSPDYLRYKFEILLHDASRGTVLGQTIRGFTYQQAGESVLDILANHASTARFISTKMTRWLLAENPPAGVIDDVTATYVATGGDIKAMIRVILAEENVRKLSSPYQPKFKRPFHFVTSLLRGLDAEVFDPLVLVFFLSQMGHSPFDWSPPNGYPDSVNVWGKSLLPRWNVASNILSNFVPGVQIALSDVLALLGNFNQKGLAKRINENILGRTLDHADTSSVEEFLAPRAPLVWPEVYEAIALAASTPGNQWY